MASGLPPRRIVLASASPRRKDLLENAGFEVIVRPADVEEIAGGMPARDLVEHNAVAKAAKVASATAGDLVLGADTIVLLEGEILGKPRDLDHAATMLGRLGGRTHEVLTGVCLMRGGGHAQCRFTETTRVSFRPLDREAIISYIASVHTLDKAGAYAAQEDGGRLIERIEGSLENVIGLPVARVMEAIRNHFTEQAAG